MCTLLDLIHIKPRCQKTVTFSSQKKRAMKRDRGRKREREGERRREREREEEREKERERDTHTDRVPPIGNNGGAGFFFILL